MNTPKRPILRYHGGKWKLAPWIITNFPQHRCYVEPFGGAASVLLRKPRSYAEIYNDLDGEVVNLFRIVRDPRGFKRLRHLLRYTPFSRDEYRESFKVVDDPIEQARRTVIRSYMGFGSNSLNRGIVSGFRANSNRSGTTPAHDWANFPRHLKALSDRLSGVVIENRDAAMVLQSHDGPETLHYVDPPYVHATRQRESKERGYTHELSDDQHRDQAGVLHDMQGMVVLSGYLCPLYQELFGDWVRIDRDALADGARKRVESLWLNESARSRKLQGDLFGGAD